VTITFDAGGDVTTNAAEVAASAESAAANQQLTTRKIRFLQSTPQGRALLAAARRRDAEQYSGAGGPVGQTTTTGMAGPVGEGPGGGTGVGTEAAPPPEELIASGKAKGAAGPTLQQILAGMKELQNGSFTLPGATGATGTSSENVPSAYAALSVPFELPHKPGDLPYDRALATVGAGGTVDMTGTNFVDQLKKFEADPHLLVSIQNMLYQAGYYTSKAYTPSGTVDAATINAWKQLGDDASGSGIPASVLLAAGKQRQTLLSDMQAVRLKINTAEEQAAAVTNSNVTLTDPNKVAQSFESAMEAYGEGPPSPEQTQAFVHAFINGPQGEIAAVQNEVDTEKRNYLAGAGDLQGELHQLQSGVTSGFTQDTTQGLQPGPTFVATKAMPDLDSEAMAAAKANNPGQYYATGASYLYGLLNQALYGAPSYQTHPEVPSAEATSGGMVTSPIAGAVA